MASTIPAFLLYAGRTLTLGSISSLTEIWMSSNIRPDLAVTYLPELGDNPSASNIINDQSVLNTTVSVSGSLNSLHCKSITEQEYIESSTVRGTIYQVNYDDEVIGGNTDPTQDENTVVLNVSSGAQIDTYTLDPDDKSAKKLYVKTGTNTYEEGRNLTINKILCLTTVSTTKRERGKSMQQIIEMGELAGNVNSAGMWGQDVGTILFNGINANPIQEVVSGTTTLTWNVTKNYTIKYIPEVAIETWDHIFYKGEYTKLYSDNQGTAIDLYPRDTLPDDL